LLRNFTVFADKGDGPFKIVAGYHQFFGATKALRSAIEASSPDGDRRIGVIWHTQGSGKSLLMAFLGGLLVRSEELENPTLLILTDRNDLDDQLFTTFGTCKDLIRQTPEQAENREELRRLLQRASGGVIFTTMQKFSPDKGEENFPELTDRKNVIVIADEAHRSQYGFDAKLDHTTGVHRYWRSIPANPESPFAISARRLTPCSPSSAFADSVAALVTVASRLPTMSRVF
jgi:type I restriction enzyme R subunit